jgi:hypothetical protein
VRPELLQSQYVVKLGKSLSTQQGVKTRGGAVKVSTHAFVWAQRETRDVEQPIRPGAREFLCYTQFAPMVGQTLDVRDPIGFVGLKEPSEPPLAHPTRHGCRGDDGHKCFDRTIDGTAERARRAIQVLESRGEPLLGMAM